jgi:hypothetical protein
MKKFFFSLLLSLLTITASQAQPQSTGGSLFGSYGKHGARVSPFILDPADYPGVSHFLFLETKAKQLTKGYATKVNKFVDAISQQPGFRASMTLVDVDDKRIVVYYQFDTEDQYNTARQNESVFPIAGAVRNESARFEVFATRPLEQIAFNPDLVGTNQNTGAGAPPNPPGYYAKFRVGEGVGINEALVNLDNGRTQAELTELMHKAGQVNDINNAAGYKDFTFHEGLDGSRNMNLIHWQDVKTLTAASLSNLLQPLMNNGLSGGHDGWGPDGPGTIHLHIYYVTDIKHGTK